MQFDTFAEFIAMGGHGPYVWLAYGAALLVFAGSFFSVKLMHRSQQERLEWLAREAGASSPSDPLTQEQDSKL